MFERGRRGRREARGLIVLAILYGLATLYMFTKSGFVDPMFYGPPGFVRVVPVLGLVSYFGGLVWMFRIYRASPEGGDRDWRYRQF